MALSRRFDTDCRDMDKRTGHAPKSDPSASPRPTDAERYQHVPRPAR